MSEKRRIVGLVLGLSFGVLLMASVGSARGVAAQEAGGIELHLTPSRDSGVSGEAKLEKAEGGVRVELAVRGLPEAGVEHINHFHGGGTCADDRAGRTAPVTIPLKPVVAREDGTGSATTVVEGVTPDELFDDGEERFLLVHAEAPGDGGVPSGIACADLVRTERVATDVLPDSGGPQTLALVAAVGLLAGLGVFARSVAQPRRDDAR